MPKNDQGVLYERYAVIPRVLVFILKDDNILLLKGSATKRIWPNQYNGIGGHIERGEDVRSAARREVKEETGLEVSNLNLCGTVMVDAEQDRGIGLYIFKGQYIQGELKESEEGTLEWVAMDGLGNIQLVEDLNEIIPLVFKMGSEDEPFSAAYSYDEQERLVIRFGE